ncbi:transketolase family protein [Allofournierella sp.]|uniref:transketolase family protein n=1 Tax=Allofournierella sp. TaxID=1940256 RepID=UPI003AB7941B
MADVKKIATRESYGRTLAQLGAEDDRIVVLDADLAESTKTCVFQKAFPERHFDCGIAEANMVSIAAGLAASGMIPFVSSFAMFAAGRAYEQIRNSVGYPHLNVKICASHAGISVGEDGATHQCNEDIALMRNIPGMVVVNPADDTEACLAVRAFAAYEGPAYMRLGRLAVPVINDPVSYRFELGRAVTLREGTDATIAATGLMVARALEAAELLAAEGIQVRLLNLHTLKPIDEEALCAAARETGGIVTAEEHSVIGGLYSAVCEALLKNGAGCRVLPVAVMDEFGQSGPAEELLTLYGLTAEHIAARVRQLLNR